MLSRPASKTIGNMGIPNLTLMVSSGGRFVEGELRSKSPVQYAGDSLVSIARSTGDDRLSLFGRPTSKAFYGSHMRGGLTCVNHFLLRRCQGLQGSDPLARATNGLKIIPLVDPSSLRCHGVQHLEPAILIVNQLQFGADRGRANDRS